MPLEMVRTKSKTVRVDIFVQSTSLSIGRDLSRNMGKVNSGIPQVPAKGLISPHSGDSAQEEVFASIKRQELPIWAQRQEIIEAISQNQVHRTGTWIDQAFVTLTKSFCLGDSHNGGHRIGKNDSGAAVYLGERLRHPHPSADCVRRATPPRRCFCGRAGLLRTQRKTRRFSWLSGTMLF